MERSWQYDKGGQKQGASNMIYGLRPLIEAIKSGKQIEKIFLQAGAGGELMAELKALIMQNKVPAQQVPTEKLNRLTSGNHQGVVGFLAVIEYASLENILPAVFEDGKVPLVVVFDRITDVRNFGAMVRTAECAGVNVVVVPSQGNAAIGEDAVKTSAGALMRVPVCKSDNLKTTIHFLKASGLQVVAATEKARMLYTEADFSKPTAIVMGSEEDGVSNELLKLCDTSLRIPLQGEIASLNVSVACGVFLFEVIRQRGA
ncbi:MAG: 23S rRNA (guanosine(2251)-2'-O)-methyltransferase RlmB [Bacteroidales bacterium]|jgi:23S rRNA (guanosine2251-2'-O)-methyltransferase|nr:23S rRNA (guanosine(2251)-2'-O)-methyltransferase RlmB [Bacteroidales bacterium]